MFNDLAKDMNLKKIKHEKTDDSLITPSDNSSATEKKDIKHDRVDLQLSDDYRSGELEDIDHVINKIKRNHKKGNKGSLSDDTIEAKQPRIANKSNKGDDLSDDTIEIKQNLDKLDFHKNTVNNAFDSESDKDNSFINFVNLKKKQTIQEHEVKHDDVDIKHSRKLLPLKTFKEESNFEN